MNAQLASSTEQELAAASVRGIRTRDDFDRNVWSLFGVPVDALTPSEAIARIEGAIRDQTPLTFTTPNVNILMRALRDPSSREDLLNSDLSLIDGAPLVAIARLFGCANAVRCAGSDIFDGLRRRPSFAGRQIRVFFFGGRDGAADAAAAAINQENRGLIAVGSLNPGHGDVESMSEAHIIETINAAKPDFVIVSLGAAKGHAWIARNRNRLSAPVVSHLGAVVDFVAGTIRRAPKWVSRTGLEWLWRIKEEPALWRRYWADGIAFTALIAQHLTSKAAEKSASAALKPATGEVETNGPVSTLRIEGDCVGGALDGLRDPLRRLAATGRTVVLDLEKVGRIDAAFLGLVLMLEKRQRQLGEALSIAGANKVHRRAFRAHKMDYPFVDLHVPAPAAAVSRIAAPA
jgi:N-acetylglucosaminyldiphosphoundecaprenol N-acetyl-beta-D-mannosaminyltransferase